jgi:hypothetical protein
MVVSIPSGSMQSGFANGTVRQQRDLPSYSIMKHPVTWAEFQGCVQSGACSPDDGSACESAAYGLYPPAPGAARVPQQPATCVGEPQAEAYCHWVGGRLPTLDEWLLAARGAAPHEYPWGDTPPTCDQYPMQAPTPAPRVLAPRSAPVSCIDGGAGDPALAVGSHSAGASSAGVEDLLLARGELLATDPQSAFNACTGNAHCVVFGAHDAVIDGVEPIYQGTADDGTSHPRALHAYGFRCAFDAK